MSFLRELIPPAGSIRVLSLSNLAKTVGHGVIMSVLVVYFTGRAGIGADRVGLALSIGAAAGMAASIPLGHLADRYGPRDVTAGLLCLLGAGSAGYAFVSGFVELVLVVAVALTAESATYAARGALIAGLIEPADRVRTFSHLRSIANVGIGIGAAGGGVALYVDRPAGYTAALLAGAACFVISGAAYLAVPSVPPVPKERAGPAWAALRDRPYLVAALLNTVLVMQITIFTVALPVWIGTATAAPSWTYSVVVVLNTVAVVLLQVRVSRGSEEPLGGAAAFRRAGLLLAGCCGLFALAYGRPALIAVAFLLAGAAVHVFGEMLQGAGQWSVSFGLAPDHAQGQYQGVFAVSQQLGTVVTPALATLLLTRLGWLGWLILALPLAGAGLAAPSVVRWALRTRPAPAVEVAHA